ncbi:MAG: hypothetical protein EXS35_10610 [Pedosphaera sp.]|nr:hypothetical protein [Pedosphaera sp.]
MPRSMFRQAGGGKVFALLRGAAVPAAARPSARKPHELPQPPRAGGSLRPGTGAPRARVFSRDPPKLGENSFTVKLRFRIALLVLLLAALGLGGWALLRSDEPEFEGRRLSAWLRNLEAMPVDNSANRRHAVLAVRQMGTNAIPSLLRMLEAGDSKWKLHAVDWIQDTVDVDLTETLANVHGRRAALGFRLLAREAAPAIPRLETLAVSADNRISSQALAVLGEIGGPQILPTLLTVLSNGNSFVRPQAAGAIGALRSRGVAAVPALVAALEDSDSSLRTIAARALGDIGLQPTLTIPALTRALKDTNSFLRAAAAMSLAAFGSQAEAALPVLRELPRDPDEFVGRAIPRAVVRLQCELRDGGIIRGPKSEKRIAFVFTGHEFAEGGETILKELARHEGRASFFFTGVFLSNSNHAPLIQRIADERHYLGPHSDQHLLYCAWEDRRTLVSEDEFTADLQANAAKLPVRPGEERRFNRYFLPAFEHYNREIFDWTRKQRWTLVNYTPGTRSNADYTGEADKNFVSSQIIFDSIVKREREDPHGLNGFILLLHIGSGPGRADKFPARFGELLDLLAGKGYEFVRVDQLLGPQGFGSQGFGPQGFGPRN